MQRQYSGTAGRIENRQLGVFLTYVTGTGRPSPVIPTRDAVYAVATHSGVTLGPLLGRLVAEELIDGRSSPLLATFRPDRFRDRTEHAPVPKLVRGGD